MLKRSKRILPPVEQGKTVIVPVPDIDKAQAATRNVFAIVVDVDEDKYQLGTKFGVIDKSFKRNEFEPAAYDILKLSDVPGEKKLKLRAVSALSSGTKEGYGFCRCRKLCTDGRCTCRKKSVFCNSKCHNSNSCESNGVRS